MHGQFAIGRVWGAHLLDDELKATEVARRFLSALHTPTHLHERGNRNRRIEHRELAAHESGRLERTRTKDAHTAVAEIMNATVEFLGPGTRRLTRQQTPCMYFERLRKALMLAPFSI